jgi:hypothetical protein
MGFAYIGSGYMGRMGKKGVLSFVFMVWCLGTGVWVGMGGMDMNMGKRFQ